MSSRAPGYWTRTAAGALLALTAVWSAPPPARAGCSQHAVPRHDPLAPVARLAILGPSADPVALSPTPAPAPDRPAPCRGPSCSRRDTEPVPAPAPASPAPARAEAWGLLAAGVVVAGPVSRAYSPHDTPSHPLRRAVTIDRPPRPSTSPAR